MKRTAQLIIALAISFCILSCNEKIDFNLSNRLEYITVTTQGGPQVKAGYEGTSSLPGVFYIDITQGSNTIYKGKVKRTDNSNRYYFEGAPEEWESSDISNVYVKAITGNGPQNTNSTLSVAVQSNQTTEDNVKSSDYLGATTGNGIDINNNSINVTFSHLLTKLVVKYTGSVAVNSMTLKNVCVSGTYDFGTMEYNYPSNPSLSNISMYHDSAAKTFEAIFCPHLPVEDQSNSENNLHLSINLGGKTLTCPITLKNSDGFMGGKCYMINVAISGSSAQNADVSIEHWNGESYEVAGERVLWIGTSIPSGDPASGIISYPELVDEAMNCTIVNNAVPSSFVVSYNPSSPDWLMPAHYVLYQIDGENGDFAKTIFDVCNCLSLSHTELESIYLPKLREISRYKALLPNSIQPDPNSYGEPDEYWALEVLEHFKSSSYSSLILPYINGVKDNCTTVIIDHGFNDIHYLVNEASSCYPTEYDIKNYVRGYLYLMELAKGSISYSEYKTKIEQAGFDLKKSYICELSKVIQAIKTENPSVRVIIGNYFTLNCPYLLETLSDFSSEPDYKNFPNLICYYNQALAGIWNLDIVNVQNYIWLDDEGYYEFCPDRVHPFNPEAAQTIADIYIRELDGVIGSRIK